MPRVEWPLPRLPFYSFVILLSSLSTRSDARTGTCEEALTTTTPVRCVDSAAW